MEWPQVITEGKTIEECREMLVDALREMVEAYNHEGIEIPSGCSLLEQISIET